MTFARCANRNCIMLYGFRSAAQMTKRRKQKREFYDRAINSDLLPAETKPLAFNRQENNEQTNNLLSAFTSKALEARNDSTFCLTHRQCHIVKAERALLALITKAFSVRLASKKSSHVVMYQ